MAVYVDRLAPCVPSKKWRWSRSAHLIADTLSELHEFAARIGLRREWFQPRSSPHYDLTEVRYQKALALGAIFEEDKRKFIAVCHKLRAELQATT